MISMYVAYSHNRVIGLNGEQPFYLPADLKKFKETTTGHTVIMGGNTFADILDKLGKPLPNRTNIVISRDVKPGDGYTAVPSLAEAIRHTKEDEESFIIGGAYVYRTAIGLADKIYATEVDADLKGDTFFPEIDPKDWRKAAEEAHQADDKNPYPYTYVTWERIYG